MDNEKREKQIGLEVAAIALTLFLGAWVARGVIERKTPTVFEVGFASAWIYLLRVDPKQAKVLAIGALKRISEESSEQ